MTRGSGLPARHPLALFQGIGVELEYMVVDSETLSVLPVTDRILQEAAGHVVSEVEMGPLAWSNELVLHVVELKTNGPAPELAGLDRLFQSHVGKINGILANLGGILLPTAMHPWMTPATETVLWPHEFSPVYESYNRIFGCQGHGWSNLQSTHLNLPFADDQEFGRLHAAIRLLLPMIPAIAASSPLVEGRPTGLLDNRMEFYRHNSRRIPSVTGAVIPEPIFTQDQYQREIMEVMFRDIRPLDREGILQHEFLNSRGALPRFGRGSIEIRVMDVQECPGADLALSQLIVCALRLLTSEALSPFHHQKSISVAPLASWFLDCIREGEEAVIRDRNTLGALGIHAGSASSREVWWHLLEAGEAAGLLPAGEPGTRIRSLLGRGTLARQILQALDVSPEPLQRSSAPVSRPRLTQVYQALAECLRDGRFFQA